MTTSSIDSRSSAESRSKNGLRTTIIVGLMLCVLQLANLIYRVEALPSEVSLRIECAKLILLGQIPYVDFFVLDSPLSLFVQAIPVKLAELLRLDSSYGTVYCTLVFEWIISVLSLALSAALFLKRKHLCEALWCRSFLLACAVLNIACVYQFGQTEHFLVLGLTPYLVARWLEYSGQKLELRETLLTGIAAGFAIMLDPSYWIACLILELALFSHFKKFPIRFVTTLAVVTATAFAVHCAIYSFGSVMMKGYDLHILPLLSADRQSFNMYLYGQMACPDSRIFYYFLCFVTLLAFGIRKRESIVVPLLVLGWLGMTYHIAMCKGFYFQALPMFWCSCLAIAVMGTSLLFDLKHLCWPRLAQYVRPAPIVYGLTIATICGSFLIEQYLQQLANTASERESSPTQRKTSDVLTLIPAKSREFDKIIVLSDSVTPFYPLATLKKRTHGSRIMWSFHMPILAKMQKRGETKEHERLSRFYKQILMEDIEKNRPTLILSDQTEVSMLFAEKDMEKLIRSHYVREEEAQFFSDNLPPREFDNPNHPLWVDTLAM